jgi:tetratricopeptide (TPR) repeat protein
MSLGKQELSLSVFLEVHETSKAFHLNDPDRVFSDTYNLGLILSQVRDFPHAEQCLANAFNIAQEEFQRDDPRLAICMYSLSVLAMDRQEFQRAEEIVRKYLGLLRETGRLESIHAAVGFYILGKTERLTGKFSDSEAHHIHALTIAGEHLPSAHPQRGLCFNELGLVHQNQMRDDDAEQDFKMALGIEEAAGRGDSLAVSDYASNLGRLYAAKRLWDEARKHLARAVAIRAEKLGESHPKTVEVFKQHCQLVSSDQP